MGFVLAAFADEAAPTLDGQIAAMKQNGIKYLEIRGVDGENIADISESKALDIRRRLDANGLAVWSLGSPFGKIGIDDEFEPHLDKFKRGIENARILGAKNIRIFSFYGEKRFDSVCERLTRFISAAKDSGVTLCHENEKGIYGDTADRCLNIHKALPELKAVFDPANFVQCGQDTKEAWAMISPYVRYMHIKDALPDGSVVPAGEGAGELAYLLKEYRGTVLTVEPHLTVFDGFDKLETGKKSIAGKYVYKDPQTAFSAAVTALRKLIGSDEA